MGLSTILLASAARAQQPDEVGPVRTVITSCLHNDGRVDVVVVNTGEAAAEYRLIFQGVPEREATLAVSEAKIFTFTGRPDDTYAIRLARDTTSRLVYASVKCDTSPRVNNQEVHVVNSCENGSGRVDFIFVNQSSMQRQWLIKFDGVHNRSTSAAGYATSKRAVASLDDGTYSYQVVGHGGADDVRRQGQVKVDCTETSVPAPATPIPPPTTVPPVVPSGVTTVEFGTPGCSADPARDRATLRFTIENGTSTSKTYDLRVGGHGHDGLLVGAGVTRTFTLKGIPYGTQNALVVLDEEQIASRNGLVFGPCSVSGPTPSPVTPEPATPVPAPSSGETTVTFGNPECAEDRITDGAQLRFEIANGTTSTKYYKVQVDLHGHNGVRVLPGQTRSFALKGIRAGIQTASVLLGETTIAERPGLIFGECKFESRILAIRFAPGAGSHVEYTRNVANPSDDVLRTDLIREMETAEDEIIAILEDGSKGQLDVERVRSIQFNERPPQSNRIAHAPGSRRPDYPNILSNMVQREIGDFCSYIEAHEIDMIWMWTNHLDPGDPVDRGAVIEPTESAMSFRGDSASAGQTFRLNISNHGNDPDWLPACAHTYVVYNMNYRLTAHPSAHIFMHQIEGYLGYNHRQTYLDPDTSQAGRKRVDKRLFDWRGSPELSEAANTTHLAFTNWIDGVRGLVTDTPNPHHIYINKGSWAAECGDAHWAPNVARHPGHLGNVVEYNFALPMAVSSSCMNWNPQGTGARTLISCATWDGCGGGPTATTNYERWWMQNLPGTDPSRTIYYDAPDGARYPIRNFWQVFSDFDSVSGEATGNSTYTDAASYMVDFSRPQ